MAITKADYIADRELLNIIEGVDSPELDGLPEHEIVANARPTSTLWELRSRLWSLIDDREKFIEAGAVHIPDLTIDEIRKGICSKKQVMNYIRDPFKAAFLASPARSYESKSTDLSRAAVARISEILALPVHGPDGAPDKGLVKIVFDAAKMILDRNYGTAIQRTENLTRVQTEKVITAKDAETIDDQLELIEAKLDGGKSRVITAEAEEEGTT